MAEKLSLNLTDRKPATPPKKAALPEPTLEEIYKPDAPVVQKVILMDRSHVEAPRKKARTMSDIKI
jgi:hypothetical protein